MKKKLLFSILAITLVFTLVGCSKEEPKKEVITPSPSPTPSEKEGNNSVAYLRFYAPNDYTYRPDLRGLIYSESQKKVFIKGDYNNDPDNVIYLIVVVETMNKEAKDYIEEINTKLKDNDVKYSLKKNNKMKEIYVRENYVIGNNTNYAYILGKSGDIYTVNIKGPKDKNSEIKKLAKDVLSSLYIS